MDNLTPEEKQKAANRLRALNAVNKIGTALNPHGINVLDVLDKLAHVAQTNPKKLIKGYKYL